MSIIRESKTDHTVELTGTDMAWWLHYHNKMSIQEAMDTVKINEGRSFYVRLPLEVNNTDDMIQYIGESNML